MQSSTGKLQKLLTVLITWAVLLGFFFLYESYFVAGQREFLIERHFRSLSALSSALSVEFERAQTSAESSLRLVASVSKTHPRVESLLDCQDASNVQKCFERFTTIYLGDVLLTGKSPMTVPRCWSPAPGRIPLQMATDNGRPTLSVSCFSREDPKQPGSADPNSSTGVFTLDMTPWIERGLQHLGDPFDDVLLAEDSGRVLFQRSTTDPRIADLSPIVANSIELGPRQTIVAPPTAGSQDRLLAQDAVQEKSPAPAVGAAVEPKRSPASEFQRLLVASAVRRAVIRGQNYELFSQPAHIALVSYPSGRKAWRLVLLGIRRTSGLDAESHALPYSTLIWIALSAVALLSLSWPLFKLRYMSNTERFSPRDGWYLVLAFFLLTTSATVILLNASYVVQARNTDDSAMRLLAGQIKKNFESEVRVAFEQLQGIRQDPIFLSARKNAEAPGLYGAYLRAAKTPLKYPYFEIAFWTNCKGDQLLKLDVRAAPTPPTDVSPFAFFQNLASAVESRSPLSGPPDRSCVSIPPDLDHVDHAYLQPVASPNTDEFAPILAAPFAGDPETDPSERISFQVLALRPMSVVDPLLPPGYGFAVIDNNCLVLFHSDSFRDLKENFCDESKNKTELRSWLVAGADTSLNISYSGRTQRAYLTSFPLPGIASNGNAFLVVFRDGERELTVNLAIILVCSILLGVYFLALVALAVLHLSLRESLGQVYAPGFVWPCPQNARVYLQMLAANLLMLSFYWVSYHRLYEASLLLLTMQVALLSVLFGIATFSCSVSALFRWGRRLAAAAIVGSLVIGILDLLLRRALLEWLFLFLLPTILGFFTMLVAGQVSSTRRLADWLRTDRLSAIAERHFTSVYALTVVSLISCVALVPCLGFFKYAYDAVSEIALKDDQILVSQDLLARLDRIRTYYEKLQAPEIARQRLVEKRDRYDTAWHTTHCDPTFDQALPDFCANPPELPADCEPVNPPATGGTWNDWVERQMARATLTFPSNEIGSAMSGLGVASTDANASWERSWLELSPRCFLLRWKPASRMPGFSVASSYRPWYGLSGPATGCLAALFAGLVFWVVRLSRQIFLTRFASAPKFETVNWKNVSEITRNSLVIGRAHSGKTKRLKALSGLSPDAWRDLRTEVLNRTKRQEPQARPCHGCVTILDHFEFNIRDRVCNLARLELLETLLYEAHCKLVIVSTVDPLYFLSEEAPSVLSDGKDPEESRRLLDRWARVLSKFTKVNLAPGGKEELSGKAGQITRLGPEQAKFAEWTSVECGGTAFLRNLGVGILEEFQCRPPTTREELVEIVLDRAGAFYHVLWSGLTGAERLVLYQLALDGWANPKNRAAIQQLERKQLIRRTPMYRIINSSLRRFVQSAEHTEEIAEWEKHEQQSTWRALRFAIIAAVVGAGVWLLYTQAQLFQIGTGYITAIATLLTALAGFSARLKRPTPQQSEVLTES